VVNRFWLLRLLGERLTLLMLVARLPLIPFSLGAAVLQSGWLSLGLVLLIFSRKLVPFGYLWIPIAIGFQILDKHSWISCFLMALCFFMPVEAVTYCVHVQRQADALLSSLLSENSPYQVQELDVPQELLSGFTGGFLDREASERYAAVMRRAMSVANMPRFSNSQAVRVFRFDGQSKDKITTAAAAYALAWYPSLVFVRHSVEKLAAPLRLQLYHELGHATQSGMESLLRPIRWEASKLTSAFMTTALFTMCSIRVYQHPGRHGTWAAVALLLLAVFVRYGYVGYVRFTAHGESEALADHIALTQPEFRNDSSWRERAQRLATRLENELKFGNIAPRHAYVVSIRIKALRTALVKGTVNPYLSGDANLWCGSLAVLYFCAGMVADMPSTWVPILFWIGLILAVFRTFTIGPFVQAATGLLSQIDARLQEMTSMPCRTPKIDSPYLRDCKAMLKNLADKYLS
jgi:hypothetical protein